MTRQERRLVDSLVQHYVAQQETFAHFMRVLQDLFTNDGQLKKHIHSVRGRLKDPDHLRDKLGRKLAKAAREGQPFGITKDNLFEKINDLTGIRILHLHTRQMQAIDTALKNILAHEMIKIVEGPVARTWDDESRAYFTAIGIETTSSETMYTSVHYVVEASTKSKTTAEIQVRTLAEEIWGEVDHAVNYPHPTGAASCAEQIKVLARVTSSCTRLVDSVFKAHDDHQASKKAPRRRRRRRQH